MLTGHLGCVTREGKGTAGESAALTVLSTCHCSSALCVSGTCIHFTPGFGFLWTSSTMFTFTTAFGFLWTSSTMFTFTTGFGFLWTSSTMFTFTTGLFMTAAGWGLHLDPLWWWVW